MKSFGEWIAHGGLAMAGRRSPWGGGDQDQDEPVGEDKPGSGGDAPAGKGDEPRRPSGPRNPWLPGSDSEPRRSAGIEDIFRSRQPARRGLGFGGGGGGFRLPPRPDGKSWFPLIVGAIILVWLAVTSLHMVGPKEEGIVTTFGKYSRTIQPGVTLTLPWPIEKVDVVDVTSINRETIPDGEAEKLMLTSDQNLVDLSYLVRWNIKNLKLYEFELSDPQQTVREVAEAAMRATVAEVPLRDAMGGAGRAEIELNARERMQAILDAYKSGVLIQGVEIKKADPPEKVVAAFQDVTAAQQDAQREISGAQGWAQQLIAKSQADAASFDKVYAQYKLAPEVTRKRMYYETMERVLANSDKVIMGSGSGAVPYLQLPPLRAKPAETDAP